MVRQFLILHDHLCGAKNRFGGRLVAVDLAPRCLRDLTYLAEHRPGLVPVLGDARKFDAWGVLIPSRVDWLFQDVAQAGQVEIFLSAVRRFLSKDGIGLLSLKAASERHMKVETRTSLLRPSLNSQAKWNFLNTST